MTSVSNAAVGAFLAGNAAAKARHGMNEAIARLSTGVRSMYGGDAAGASVAHTLRADGRSALMAARNVEDGISFLQAGEAALLEIAALNTRLRELAVQDLNAAFLDANQEAAITAEENAVLAAGNAIDTATLNDVALLTAGVAFTTDMDGGLTTLGAAAGLTLAAGVSNVDTQMGKISKALGSMAAGIAALKGHQGTLYALSSNAEAAAARIQDTDFARSSANLAKFSILNQSAMAMVSQANQANAAVLAVLQ
jgi:flagellin